MKLRHYVDAAHQLNDSEDLITKKCAELHGHTYAVEVQIAGAKNDKHGMIIDFSAIKEVINIIDHKYINAVFLQYGIKKETTAENIALFLAEELGRILPKGINLTLSLCEGYKGEDHSPWVTVVV